ncbi:MAG: hypothetical protein AAF969_03115 [Bacteroidota bacterium]
MDIVQNILVYLTLALAVGYLLWKFVLPKSLISGRKKSDKSCGHDGCGCD